MELNFKSYVVSDDKLRIQVQVVVDYLATSYWANNRPAEKIIKSIENSICYGVYELENEQEQMIAFARIITDCATTYYLCDVFVLEAYRGQGISKKLIETITNAPEFQGMTGLLGTKDAQGLYEQYGFERDQTRFMRRPVQINKV
ncbi:GNAT family N-acetyltransferase [Paenibacillus sp. FSL H8-0537]|uniref:GNAT family N-acetyltransferase n=1 Tax=Paenibacillus sp. FSL H8-0537 TaxID=2921399 RepID=UPI003100CF83